MPIYEYRCVDCDESFEAFLIAGDPDAECPKCHGGRLSRELSVFASHGHGDSNQNGAAGERPSGGGCCGGGCGCCG